MIIICNIYLYKIFNITHQYFKDYSIENFLTIIVFYEMFTPKNFITQFSKYDILSTFS